MFEEWSSCIVVGILLITIVMCIFACKHLWDNQQEIRADMRYHVTEEHMKEFVGKFYERSGGGNGRNVVAMTPAPTF